MNNDELNSQLSAMFDGELPEAQCELLARRLARDEALKAHWGRYAVIGAAIRGEGGARLDTNLALRVSAAISGERALTAQSVEGGKRLGSTAARWWQPVAGVAVAAGVAAVSLMWLRQQLPADTGLPLAQTAPMGVQVTAPMAAAPDEADSYTVPVVTDSQPLVPMTALANYVVAHSEFSAPLSRRNLLTTLVASEPGTAEAVELSEDSLEDSPQHVD